jgi:hypothetical protein
LNEKQLQVLANLEPSSLPEEIKSSIKAGDNTHWCCSNEKPPKPIDRTRVEAVTKSVATRIKVGYTGTSLN